MNQILENLLTCEASVQEIFSRSLQQWNHLLLDIDTVERTILIERIEKLENWFENELEEYTHNESLLKEVMVWGSFSFLILIKKKKHLSSKLYDAFQWGSNCGATNTSLNDVAEFYDLKLDR